MKFNFVQKVRISSFGLYWEPGIPTFLEREFVTPLVNFSVLKTRKPTLEFIRTVIQGLQYMVVVVVGGGG